MSVDQVETEPADAGGQEETEHSNAGSRFHDLLHDYPTLGPSIVLVVAIVTFSFTADNFLAAQNLSLVVQQVVIVGTLAIGQTLIILTAGIDLSVGSIMVLSSVVMAKLAVETGLPAPVALLVGFGIAALCGAINGLLVTKAKLPPFIVTLGTLSVFFALNLWYSESTTVLGLPDLLLALGNSFDIFGTRVTWGTVVMLLLFAATWYALRWTPWGRHVYAIGDDAEAARLTGIRTARTTLSVYVVAGLIYGVTAWILLGRIGSASPQAGQTANLDSITAVVLGGTSLFGGRGNVFGTLLGALIVGLFRNGLSLSGVDDLWQNFAVGILVIVAVVIDQRIREVRA